MKKYATVLLFTVAFCVSLSAQTITGSLSQFKNQPIRLEGFNGLKSYAISMASIDSIGNFMLQYMPADYGVGYLISSDNKPLFVILSGEDVEIKGEALSYPETLRIGKGQENQWFAKYAMEHPRREQVLSAWTYLEQIYTQDSLFATQDLPRQAIQSEKQRLTSDDADFLDSLPRESYVSWYLPTRQLVSSVSVVAQYRTKEIPATIAAFRKMDYTDPRLYKSGLYKDAIESHFWLLENSGRSLDSVYVEMQRSIDVIMIHLFKDEQKLNEVTDYLFDLLERHSLFRASEYLAVKVLNEVSCTIDADLAKQLETYRAMKVGNIAPDILLDQSIGAPVDASGSVAEWLSELGSDYTLVVFGASWCPKCIEELPEIAKNYDKWQNQDIEVVFVSLDDDKEAYMRFTNDFPFISICDYQKWNGQIVQDYYVFATPTMYLLNDKREILLRPSSAKEVDAWVEGNK